MLTSFRTEEVDNDQSSTVMKKKDMVQLKSMERDKDRFDIDGDTIEMNKSMENDQGKQEPEIKNKRHQNNQASSVKTMASKGCMEEDNIKHRLMNRKVKNVQQVYLDSDYWYRKGVVLNLKQ